VRLVFAGCSFLFVAGLAGLLFWRHGSTTVTVTHGVTGGGTYVTQMIQPNSSIYQENPGPVTVILLLMLVAVSASTQSVVYRAVKRSPKRGITGLVVASLVGAFCVLGIASVGLFILPIEGLLVVLALPMSKLARQEDASHT
jgi:hypothetical protein